MDIGLKVDTTHIGWCVTKEFDIVKKNKQLIGVDLFNEASTNEARRIFRSTRRMNQRKAERIKFLTDVFERELNKKDMNFITRLKESGLLEEDRSVKGNIFESKEEEKAFFKNYPTIYHLRSHMLQNGDDDIRLLYLALLHMFKHRGNFLLKDVNAKSAVSFQKTYKELRIAILDIITLPKEPEIIDSIENIISSKKNNKQKLSEIMELLGFRTKDKVYTTIFQLLLGMKGDIKNIFPNQLEGYDENTKINFAECDDYDTLKASYETYLEIEQIRILDAVKAVYDWSKLTFILKGEKYISDAMVKNYNKHFEDLVLLKEILKYCKKIGDNNFYKEMFQTTEFKDGKIIANYAAYVGKARDLKKKRQVTCSQNEFYSYTKKMLVGILEKLEDSKEDNEIKEKINGCLVDIDNFCFLPKQKTKENLYIPNVILAEEMSVILTKAAEKHLFLLEREPTSGLSVMDALLEVYSFQIPYWVGPVNGDEKYAWAVKKEGGHVYPWNISQKIDLVQTRRKFMDNIIGDCSILFYEKVLPDNSFYVRKMLCLDEINKIRINGEKLPIQAKQLIFNELFCKYDRVTQKGIITLLEKNGFIDTSFENEYSGFTKRKLNQNMAPYVKAIAVYPELEIETYEKIAEYITVCKSDKKLLAAALKSEIELDEDVLNSLRNVIRDSGWSEYSKKAITDVVGKNKDDGIERNIIDQLYYTQSSLNEILGSSYDFIEKFEEINKKSDVSIKEMIDEIKNPKIRRSFQQMVNVVRELRNYLKKEPKSIYMNVYAPADMNKMHLQNRKAEVMKLLKEAEEKELIKQLKKDATLSLKKYLYYMQKGRCLYSGEIIPYDEVEKNNSCFNVEHILPQSKVYDNSVNNLCLVKKELNMDKGNTYPLNEELQKEMLPYWNKLLSEGFLTVKKYEALTSKAGIPIERKLESIDKLLVEHRKTARKAAVLINRVFPNSKVIFVSDTLLDDFKNKLDYRDSENINELGSAKDAYYVTICGKTWNGIFGNSPKKYIIENPSYSLNVYNYNSEFWKIENEESKSRVDSVISNAHIIQTVMAFSKESGSLYNMSLLSRKYIENCKTNVSGRKGNYKDAQKYGGYNTLTISHFCIIKTDNVIKIEPIPLIFLNKLKTEQDYIKYFENKGMSNITILKKQLLKKTVFVINGFKYYLASINENSLILDNGIPFYLTKEDTQYFLNVQKFNRQMKTGKIIESLYKIITMDNNIKFLDMFLEKYQTVYHNRINSGIDKLVEARKNNYINLSLEQQCIVIENLFGLVYRKRPIADLKLIGLSANSGKVAINKIISKMDSCIMIEESATGLYSKKTVLK